MNLVYASKSYIYTKCRLKRNVHAECAAVMFYNVTIREQAHMHVAIQRQFNCTNEI